MHRQIHKNNAVSKAHRRDWQIGSKNPMYGKSASKKKIIAFNDNYYRKFNSLTECAKELNIPHTSYISAVLTGIHKSTRGYKFKYDTEGIIENVA